jgi:uncharacterized membrane protein YdbT with pleckstrin-like domain
MGFNSGLKGLTVKKIWTYRKTDYVIMVMVMVVVVIIIMHVFYLYFIKALTLSDFVNKKNKLMPSVLHRARVLLRFC